MDKISLTIKHDGRKGEDYTVTGSKFKIGSLIKWITAYNHGIQTSEDTVVCSSSNDMRACRLKAKHLNLLSD